MSAPTPEAPAPLPVAGRNIAADDECFMPLAEPTSPVAATHGAENAGGGAELGRGEDQAMEAGISIDGAGAAIELIAPAFNDDDSSLLLASPNGDSVLPLEAGGEAIAALLSVESAFGPPLVSAHVDPRREEYGPWPPELVGDQGSTPTLLSPTCSLLLAFDRLGTVGSRAEEGRVVAEGGLVEATEPVRAALSGAATSRADEDCAADTARPCRFGNFNAPGPPFARMPRCAALSAPLLAPLAHSSEDPELLAPIALGIHQSPDCAAAWFSATSWPDGSWLVDWRSLGWLYPLTDWLERAEDGNDRCDGIGGSVSSRCSS